MLRSIHYSLGKRWKMIRHVQSPLQKSSVQNLYQTMLCRRWHKLMLYAAVAVRLLKLLWTRML